MGGRNCLQVVGLLMFIVGFPKNIIDMFAATLMLLHIWLSNVSLDTKARSMLHGTVASSRCPGHFWRIWMSSRSVSSDPMMFLVRIWYASLFHGRFYPLYIPYLPYLTPKKWSNLTFMYTPMAVPCSHNHPPTRDTRTTRGVSPCRAGLPALEVCLGNSVSSSLVLHLLLGMIREYEWIW